MILVDSFAIELCLPLNKQKHNILERKLIYAPRSTFLMACNEDMRTDEEDQRVRSTKKIKRNEEPNGDSNNDSDDTHQDKDGMTEMDMGDTNAFTQQEKKSKDYTSYKNKHKLLGINGNEATDNSDESDSWRNKEESDSEIQDMEESQINPLCPSVPVTSEERIRLCKPWRKAVIIKLLGRKIGYRFLMGRLTKLWNLVGNFEFIDLQNDFFPCEASRSNRL